VPPSAAHSSAVRSSHSGPESSGMRIGDVFAWTSLLVALAALLVW
jgi:hypothetical protein